MLVLALCCGLRRHELDKLLWSQVDLNTGKLSIDTTRFFRAKSDASNAEVDMEPELVALLRGWKLRAKSPFVIESEVEARLDGNSAHYRLARQFDSLIEWLRLKGVDTPKPLHTLRKEYGALVLKTYGIYAASRALRHEDLQVTVKHYADTKERATPGLGAMLAPANVEAAQFIPASSGAVSETKTKKRKARA
jgi:integrase